VTQPINGEEARCANGGTIGSEALKLERSALKAINNALGDADPSSKLLFLLKHHGALSGQAPADAVVDGKLEDVLRLAGEWAKT
jgi:hypothetical protein